MQKEIVFRPIGVINSPHADLCRIPAQPVYCEGIEGTVSVDPEYAPGLEDLGGFSHIHIFYFFHQSKKICLRFKPYLGESEKGIFSVRAPHRPNKLGMSLVRLDRIEENILYIRDVDILDGTPLLDIKPYIQRFDRRESVRSGWQEEIADDDATRRGRRGYDAQKSGSFK
ncbi:MAG: tRNA (N6-threonylcarbamoyladenosine(37)-N6)-methyltransferase TrmO [Thermodesulfobacteriota bacterium]